MKRAFTITELMSVIAILMALVALTAPALSSAMRQAHTAQATSNLKSLYGAISIYRSEYDGDSVYGQAHLMGLPDFTKMYGPPGDPARVIGGTDGLWHSPCGRHPYSEIPESGTNQLRYYASDRSDESWIPYVQKYEENTMLVVDPNCSDHSVPLAAPLYRKKVLGIRLSGQFEIRWARDTASLDVWHDRR